MRYFDLHCDTVTECFAKSKALFSNDLHLALDRAPFNGYTQVFAVWVPDTLRGKAAQNYFNQCADFYQNQLLLNKKTLEEKQITPVLAVEGGAALGGTLSGLKNLADSGVKVMTITWNYANELASGAYESEGGLTVFGREVLRETEKLHITVDVSHLNRKSFFDIAEQTDRPFIASHSNLDTVDTPEGRKRNLTVEQAKEIIRRKGLLGVNFYTRFLQREGEDCFDAVYRRVAEYCDLGGENAVCFGSDFDGCAIDPKLSDIEKIPVLYEYLQGRGLNELLLEKIFYQNASEYFQKL